MWIHRKKGLLCLLLAAALLALTGCSSGEDKKEAAENTPLYVVVAATYVDDPMLEGLREELGKVTAAPDIVVSGVSMGDTEKDPMGAMAGMTQLGGRMASKEIDVLITDADIARRFGDNGEAYLPINDTFESGDIERFSAGLACVAIVNDEGEVTDEVSAPCGARLSENASALTGLAEMQMFIPANTKKTEMAKAVFTHLATLP